MRSRRRRTGALLLAALRLSTALDGSAFASGPARLSPRRASLPTASMQRRFSRSGQLAHRTFDNLPKLLPARKVTLGHALLNRG